LKYDNFVSGLTAKQSVRAIAFQSDHRCVDDHTPALQGVVIFLAETLSEIRRFSSCNLGSAPLPSRKAWLEMAVGIISFRL
jgi:hypothetical protein